MAPEDEDDSERYSDLIEDETLDFGDEDEASDHSESVFVVDDDEAGRESFARTTSATLDHVIEQNALADELAAEGFVDADPTAMDAEAGLAQGERAEGEAAAAPRDDVARKHLRGLLEALLFVADRAMKTADLAEIARADNKEVRTVLEELSEQYRADGRGFQLDELAGGWQVRTSAAFAPFVRELTQAKPVKLSRAQVETLAIIAYRQPITRPEIEDIRGVDAGAVLKLLLDRDLVRILGKKDEPGRPLLYGTTGHFLSFFGLKSLKDLPTLREFTELTEESREVVERELGEVLPEGPRELPPDLAAPPAGEEPMTPPGEPAEHRAPEELHTPEEAAALEAEAEGAAEPAEEQVPDDDEREEALAAANDTAEDDEPPESEPKEAESPGGSSYDPSDEELFPDDDDDDFDDEDDDDDDDEEEEDDDEDE